MDSLDKLIIEKKLEFYNDLIDFMFWTLVLFDVDYSYTKEAITEYLNEYPEPIADVNIKCENWQNRNIWVDKLGKLYNEIRDNDFLLINANSELREYVNSIIERNELKG